MPARLSVDRFYLSGDCGRIDRYAPAPPGAGPGSEKRDGGKKEQRAPLALRCHDVIVRRSLPPFATNNPRGVPYSIRRTLSATSPTVCRLRSDRRSSVSNVVW
jgi:hypothetical protein